MKNLADEVKILVNQGRWSLYSIAPYGKITYWLHCPAVPRCCSAHPDGDPEHSYFLDDDGNVVATELPFKPEPISVHHFPDVVDPLPAIHLRLPSTNN